VKRSLGALARVAQRTTWTTLFAVTACGTYLADDSECSLDRPAVALPSDLLETSGVAVSLRDPGLIWTHNDQGHGSFLYAVDGEGQIRARVELNQSNGDDWEDIARGNCDLGACLYVAGTGDNQERRDIVSLYRLAEPEGEGDGQVEAKRYRMVLPDGPRDIEAMYVLPTDQIFFVTKGRNHPVTVYHYPLPLRADDIVTLVEVQRLTSGPSAPPRQVTGASATLDGGTVVIRTYQSLEFFEVTEGGQLRASSTGRVSLRTLREAQGEGIGFGANGAIVLSSEGAGVSGPSLTFLSCEAS